MQTVVHHTDKELYRRVAAGEETAFRSLYDLWHAKVYSLCMYLTRSTYMSEEITQEVFLKIWHNRHQLNDIEYFSSWVRTIARNTIINQLKANALERLALQNFSGDAEHADVTGRTVLANETARLISAAVTGLSPKQKEVWLLTRHSGLTLAEAAERMGITRHTAKEHLSRAVTSLRAQLEGHIELVVTVAISIFLK